MNDQDRTLVSNLITAVNQMRTEVLQAVETNRRETESAKLEIASLKTRLFGDGEKTGSMLDGLEKHDDAIRQLQSIVWTRIEHETYAEKAEKAAKEAWDGLDRRKERSEDLEAAALNLKPVLVTAWVGVATAILAFGTLMLQLTGVIGGH